VNLFRTDYYWHSWAMYSALADYDAEALLDMRDFSLRIRARHRDYRFYPLFIARDEKIGKLSYVRVPNTAVRGFAGWLPYFNKRWPIGSGKLAFKDFCGTSGLPTPRFWRSPTAETRDFLVKHDTSSFGSGMRGPFRSYQSKEAAQALGEGGYCEQFIQGRTLKAWYWEERLACVEEFEMSTVTGDGKSRMRELMQRYVRPGVTYAGWDRFEDLARFQGVEIDEVLTPGQTVLADINFSSPMHLVELLVDNSLERYKDVLEKLRGFGRALWLGIPEDIRPASLFTVDAIVDSNASPWLLEMNCNPAGHPEAYPFMLETLFGPRQSATEQLANFAVPPASALPPPHAVRHAPLQPGLPPGVSFPPPGFRRLS
jgi:hypothetical protein